MHSFRSIPNGLWILLRFVVVCIVICYRSYSKSVWRPNLRTERFPFGLCCHLHCFFSCLSFLFHFSLCLACSFHFLCFYPPISTVSSLHHYTKIISSPTSRQFPHLIFVQLGDFTYEQSIVKNCIQATGMYFLY